MEDLNKNQIILLTLLISFVTSIATGIMTSSLLQEAPLEVTRNINRIVEKTIETVTPATVTAPAQKEVTTVVVKEDDLIVDSINKNLKSIVRIKEKDGVVGTVSLYGIGLVITKDGMIAADRKTIISGDIYSVVMSDGVEFPLTIVGIDKQTNFLLFKANQGEKVTDKTAYPFSVAQLSDSDPKLGQTIIALGGEVTNAVSVGRVISFDMKESGVGTTSTKYLSGINTDLSTKDLIDGSPAFNLSGDLVGVKLSDESSKVFVPVSILKKEITILNEPAKNP
jgi:S1-C subfamily serine protease